MKMNNKNRDVNERIELRSEKVRDIIGSIPQALVWCGVAVIIIVIVGLVLAVMIIPYPYSDGETILQHLCSFF